MNLQAIFEQHSSFKQHITSRDLIRLACISGCLQSNALQTYSKEVLHLVEQLVRRVCVCLCVSACGDTEDRIEP